MKLSDLEWQVNYLLRNSSLPADERIRLQKEIKALIQKFGDGLIIEIEAALVID